jgi:glycogen(starch) synthase
MRLLLISTSYPPVLGGLQTVAQQVAQHMHKRGHAVRVLTMRYPRQLPSHEVCDGVPIVRALMLRPNLSDLQRGRLDLALAACFYYPLTLRRLARLMRDFQPQAVNFHFPTHLTHFVLWLRRRAHFRLIVSLHGHDVLGDAERSAYERRQFRQLLAQADAITACSADLRARAIALVPSAAPRIAIHYNGVDLTRFADRTPYEHPRPYVLYVGRLVSTKGVDLLVQAFAQAAQNNSELDLLLAGEGELHQSLSAQASALGMEKRVHLLGRASPQDVVRLLNSAQFAVFPSRAEPFGIVAVEAMAAGKAVLATRVGGFPEVLPVPPNRLVEPTADALAAALNDWLGRLEDVRRVGEQNRAFAQRFDLQHCLARYEATLLGAS